MLKWPQSFKNEVHNVFTEEVNKNSQCRIYSINSKDSINSDKERHVT